MSEKRYKDPYSCGARAGRWNSRGTKMIYASSSPSLAQLEYICINGNVVGLNSWYMVIYEILDSVVIAEIEANKLPFDWDSLPHSLSTQNFGDELMKAGIEAFIKVPSARLNINFYPTEHNLLINPEIKDLTTHLKVVNTTEFRYNLNA